MSEPMKQDVVKEEGRVQEKGKVKAKAHVNDADIVIIEDAGGTAHNMGVSRILQEARKSESPDKLRNRLRRAQRKLKEME